MAMHLLDTVTGPLTTEAMPLHHTGRSAALGGADDVNEVDTLKQPDRQHAANFDAGIVPAELANKPLRLAVSLDDGGNPGLGSSLRTAAIELGDMTANRPTGQPAGLVEKANLNGRIAVTLDRTHLSHRTRTSFNHGDRHHSAVGIKHLRHPDLAAKEALPTSGISLCFCSHMHRHRDSIPCNQKHFCCRR